MLLYLVIVVIAEGLAGEPGSIIEFPDPENRVFTSYYDCNTAALQFIHQIEKDPDTFYMTECREKPLPWRI